MISRRCFLKTAVASPLASVAAAAISSSPGLAATKRLPIGLELYSVRNELAKDPIGTVQAVAKMGYEVVEFFAPYYAWTPDQAREMRKVLDDLGIRCHSTHNGLNSFSDAGIGHAMELSHIIGSKYIVLASSGDHKTLDEWKKVADTLSEGAGKMKAAGLRAGYHNHQAEFTRVEGRFPMEVLAANTPRDLMLQLDVGTCLEAGADPVAWIESNPGRTNSLHLKDWSAKEGYQVLLGEGSCPWKKIFKAVETRGGGEYYLIEQEGSAYSPLETAARSLANYKKLNP